jgi:1-acyl-sn-glycerol-3-phosphate acyltransferase
MLKTIYSFACVVISVIFLTPFGAAAAVLSLLGLRKPMTVIVYRIAQGWAYFLLKVVNCKITVKGRENIPADSGFCFVSNHGSIFDILLLLRYAGRPFGFVAKKELVFLPFLNMWILVLGGLFIDRKNPRNALKTINAGVARIKAGGGMVIFPEGHRSRERGLLPFHPGSLKLATKSVTVIVPVALTGTWEIFEKNYRVTSNPVSITFCKPIDTADLSPEERKQALTDRIYGVIKEALEGSRE